MSLCSVPDCQIHYGCRMRAKGIRLSAKATPSRMNDVAPRVVEAPSWNKGVVVDRRRNGEVMPLLAADSSRLIRTKEYSERRHEIDAHIKRLKGPS